MLEDSLLDHTAYQEFVGLSPSEDVPELTTHWRFKEKVMQQGLYEKLFTTINEQLAKQDLRVEQGKASIIDATIIPSSNRPLSKHKRQASSTKTNHQIDQDARSSKKRGRYYFGYKGHINVDAKTKLIQRQGFTAANVHDIKKFESLLTGREQEVYADKAYSSKDLERKARLVKVKYKVMRKGTRSRALSKEDKAYNKQLSKVRSRVEHVFGTMKKDLGYKVCRAKTIGRNQLSWIMNCVVYNILRTSYLLKTKT